MSMPPTSRHPVSTVDIWKVQYKKIRCLGLDRGPSKVGGWVLQLG